MQIKTIIMAFVVFIVIAGTAFALDLSYGVKSELLFTGFTGSHSKLEGFSRKEGNGFALGGFAKISLEDILSVQPELLFNIKTDKYINKETDEKLSLILFYIEAPILFNVSFPLPVSIYLAPKLFAGPYFGIHLFSNDDVKSLGIDFKPYDFGIIVGMGIDVQKMSFEITHREGLISLSESLKHDTHSINIGVKLKLK